MFTLPKKIIFLCLLLLSAVSLFWFTSHVLEKFPWEGQYPQRDPDSLLFARLFEQSVLREKILETDNYGAYPYEIKHGFAPFYMYFLVQATGLFYTIFPNCGFDPVNVAGILPVIFTWLTGIIVLLSLWFISRNSRIVLFSAFCMLPGYASIMVGTFLKLDYDFLISFYIWSWICLNAIFMHRPSALAKIAAGIIAALFVATWSGAPFFFFFVTIYGFALWLAAARESSDCLEFSCSGMLIGGILNLLFIVSGKNSAQIFSINKYSLFQPLCLVIGGFFLMSLKYFASLKRSRTVGLLAMFAASAAIALIFRGQILQSTGILLQKDPVHKEISELVSIFRPNKLVTSTSEVATLVENLGWPVILLPFFIIFRPTGLSPVSGRLFKFWLVAMTLLTSYQIRYIRWLTVGNGLYAGIVFSHLWDITSAQLRRESWKNLLLALAFFPALLVFSLQSFSNARLDLKLSDLRVEAYNWIAANTPVTSGYFDENRPEYSILSTWGEGNLLSYYTRRPVATNNAMWGYKTMADIFSTANEDDAFALCNKMGVRYIFISTARDFGDEACSFWATFKSLPEKPEYELQYKQIELLPRQVFSKWFYFWLRDNLSLTRLGEFNPGTRFRVIYASKADKATISSYILFERVAGARLNFSADPGSEASISLMIKVAGKEFLYKTSAVADQNGKVTFVLPYSTGHHGGRVQTEPFYKLAFFENQAMVKATVKISNAEVLEGGVAAGLTRLPLEAGHALNSDESVEGP